MVMMMVVVSVAIAVLLLSVLRLRILVVLLVVSLARESAQLTLAAEAIVESIAGNAAQDAALRTAELALASELAAAELALTAELRCCINGHHYGNGCHQQSKDNLQRGNRHKKTLC